MGNCFSSGGSTPTSAAPGDKTLSMTRTQSRPTAGGGGTGVQHPHVSLVHLPHCPLVLTALVLFLRPSPIATIHPRLKPLRGCTELRAGRNLIRRRSRFRFGLDSFTLFGFNRLPLSFNPHFAPLLWIINPPIRSGAAFNQNSKKKPNRKNSV